MNLAVDSTAAAFFHSIRIKIDADDIIGVWPDQFEIPTVPAAYVENSTADVAVFIGGVFPRPPVAERGGVRIQLRNGVIPAQHFLD